MSTNSVPPGPKGSWPFGTTPLQHGRPLEVLTNWSRQYGDVVSWRIFHLRVYLLNHPDDIETVLVTRQRSFIKGRGLRANREALGDGLLTSEGDFWLRQRRLIQPAFHRERVAAYAPVMAARVAEMLDGWRDGETRDVHRDLMRLTLEIAAQTLFGVSVSHEAAHIDAALEVLMAANTTPFRLYPLMRHLPTPGNRRYTHAVRELDRIVYGIIADRRAHTSGGAAARSATDRPTGNGDLLSRLLDAADEDGSRMTDRQLRDECVTLLLAGHETTALALSWACYLLAQHREAQESLHAELDRVLGGRPPSLEDLVRLPYTEAVVREALRLYPPAWLMPRLATEDLEIHGYRIAKGTSVVMSQWIVHRDPRWFADPERFNPGRWSEEFARKLPRFAYFPFGGGPRLCVGASFALIEAVLLLAAIAQRFRWSLAAAEAVEPVATMTLRPKGGIWLALSRR